MDTKKLVQNDTPLNRDDLLADPIAQFATWYLEAQSSGEFEPSAMTLSTVNKAYEISARMVLLKSFDQKGFVFFTNYLSPKALALKEVPKAALVFWWPLTQRQVRINGDVVLLDPASSDKYFNQRIKTSRIAAIVSKQSSVIDSRDVLLEQYQAETKKYENTDTIARPEYWGGYVLAPTRFEFWQGRSHRLHDRFQYNKTPQGWDISQLSP